MKFVNVVYDDRQLQQVMQELERAGRDRAPAMRKIAQGLQKITDDNFAAEGRPKWAPLKNPSERRRGGMILQDRGILINSITTDYDADAAVVGTNLIYGPLQHFGGEVKREAREHTVYFRQNKDGMVGTNFVRKSKSNFAQSTTIGEHTVTHPARPFLPMTADGDLQPEARELALETVMNHLQAAARM